MTHWRSAVEADPLVAAHDRVDARGHLMTPRRRSEGFPSGRSPRPSAPPSTALRRRALEPPTTSRAPYPAADRTVVHAAGTGTVWREEAFRQPSRGDRRRGPRGGEGRHEAPNVPSPPPAERGGRTC